MNSLAVSTYILSSGTDSHSLTQGEGNFWLAFVVVFIVMVLLGIVPVIGPIISGLVPGLIAPWRCIERGEGKPCCRFIRCNHHRYCNHDWFYDIWGATGFLIAIAGSLVLLLVFLSHAVLGFIGGVIGGRLRP